MIDDERSWHDLLRRFFIPLGYRVWTAFTAEEGLRLAASGKPDCLVIDPLLAAGGAVGICAALRNSGRGGIPVIIFSSDPAVELDAYSRCMAEGFVLKGRPGSLAALQKAIEAALAPPGPQAAP